MYTCTDRITIGPDTLMSATCTCIHLAMYYKHFILQFYIGYKKPLIFNLHTPRKRRLSSLVVRGKPTAIARYCLLEPKYCTAILTELGKVILKEMCSDKVRGNKVSALESFTWEKVTDEAKLHAPLTFNLLSSCTTGQQNKTGYVLALLCNLRWSCMNLFQKMVSLILYAGHCSKQVSLYVCMYMT